MKSFIVFVSIFLIFPLAEASIPTKDFFATPDLSQVILNPEGSKIASVHNLGMTQVVKITATHSLKEKHILMDSKDFFENDSYINQILWVDNDNLAIHTTERQTGVKDLVDTKTKHHLIIANTKSLKNPVFKSIRSKGIIVNALPNETNMILFAKNSFLSKVYKIDVSKLLAHDHVVDKLTKIDGGQFVEKNKVIQTKGWGIRWFFDDHGKALASTSFQEDSSINLTIHSTEEPVVIKSWTKEDLSNKEDTIKAEALYFPIAYANEENTFYCINSREDKEQTLYKVNFKDNTSEIAFQTNGYEIADILIDPSTGKLAGAKVIHNGAVQFEYLNASPSKNSNRLDAVLSKSNNGEIHYSESHSQPGAYYYINNQSKVEFGRIFPKLPKTFDSTLIKDEVNVEGLSIPFYLSLPKKKNPSLVVLPHGGPIGIYDNEYYDSITQFLNYHGFAVLRVNFRGSGGYTKEFEEAGKMQWGELMLEDIHSATIQTIESRKINSNRICIMGLSYGGYAATELAIKHSEVFKCAINIAGVSDLNLHLNTPLFTKRQLDWTKEYIGNPKTDYDHLFNISPVSKIKELKVPLFIAHGMLDDVVDVEQFFRLKILLEKESKDFLFQIFEDEKHHFKNIDNRVKLFDKSLEFLNKHI